MASQFTSSRNTGMVWRDQEEPLTNFCANIECLLPLSPDDIHNHYEFHTSNKTTAQIQSIKSTKAICAKKVSAAIQELSKGIEDNDIRYILNPEELFNQEVKKMEQCRDTMIDIIKIFIEIQKKKLKSSIELNLLKVKDIGGVFVEIKEVIGQLEGLRNSLEDTDPFPSISKACRLDVKSMLDRYKSQIKKVLTTRDLDPIVVHIDEQRLFQLNQHLNKIIHVITHQEDKEDEKSEATYSHKDAQVHVDQSHHFSDIQDQSRNDNQSVASRQGPPAQSNQAYYQNQQNFDQNPSTNQNMNPPYESYNQFQNTQKNDFNNLFQVQQPDFFDKACNKFLHFFKNDDTLLYFLDLTQIEQTPKFRQIRLKQDFNIPYFHRSISTPKGQIYVSGGTQRDDQKNKLIYLFNPQNQRLEGVAQLQIARSSHSMVFFQNEIYIISGFALERQLTASVERFNIQTGACQKMADCLQPSNSPTCCTFQDNYIYKFGGNLPEGALVQIIERYDIHKNTWEHIDPKLDQHEIDNFDQIYQYAACCQINKKNILIFGGYDQDNQGTSFSFLLTDEQGENTINGTNIKPLPSPEAFWNNQAIIYNNQLFVIQNIDVNGEVDETRRKILSFNGKQWIDHGEGE